MEKGGEEGRGWGIGGGGGGEDGCIDVGEGCSLGDGVV